MACGRRSSQKSTSSDRNPTAMTSSDLEFNVELELLPDIAMPDFQRSIELTRLQGGSRRPEAVDKALDQIAKFNRTLDPISPRDPGRPRPRRDAGEVLTVDFAGKIDDVAFHSRAAPARTIWMSKLAATGFIPGFAEGNLSAPARASIAHYQRHLPRGLRQGQGTRRKGGDVRRRRQTSSAPSSFPPIDDALAKKLGASRVWPRCAEISYQPTAAGIRQIISRMRLKRCLMR